MPYRHSERVAADSVPAGFPLAPGQVVGDRYLIGSTIGEGGMGVVCSARHLGLDAPVAIKVIRPDLREDPELVHRFVNEARTAAVLKGEHIARVHDVGQLESGEPYLVMEKLDGMALEDFIEHNGPLGQTEAADLVFQVCEGLAEAHALALVHRDIKPANLFLARLPNGRELLKILDFGISKRLFARSHKTLTDPAKSLGSPWYMSPEQMKDASRVDQRADIWSLGVLLFELLTKEHPFDGLVVAEVCAKVLTEPTPKVREHRPDVDPGLEAIIDRCLEKDPERRYPNVSSVMHDLQPFTSRLTPTHERDSFGSLAPLAKQPHLGRGRRSRVTPVWTAVCTAAALGWFGWQEAWPQLGLPSRAALSALELPWDPALGTGPLELGAELAPEFENPAMIVKINAEDAPRPETPRSPAAGAGAILTPEEIRLRTARYEQWLKSQGLTRLEDVENADPFGNPNTVQAEPSKATE